MKVDKISRYRIVARLQHVQQSLKYWVTMSEIIQQNDQFPEWTIVNIQKSRSVSYMDNRNGKRRRYTHHIEL